MSASGLQTRMAVPLLSVRPTVSSMRMSQRPSRLPLHRPAIDKSPASSSSSVSVSHAVTSSDTASVSADAANQRLANGSHLAHKSTQVGLNRMSPAGRQQGVASETPTRRRSQPAPRPLDETRVRPQAGQTALCRSVNGNDVASSSNSACEMQMSAMRSTNRQQQPQSPIVASSSRAANGRHRASAKPDCGPAASGVQRRRTAARPSLHSSTTSVDSACSQQHRAAPFAHETPAPLSSSSSAFDNHFRHHDNVTAADRQRAAGGTGRNTSSVSSYYPRRKSAESSRRDVAASVCADKILQSPRSESADCLFGAPPPASRRLPPPAADRQRDRRRERSTTTTSDVFRPTRHEERRPLAAAVTVEPRRRGCSYNLMWQLSESDVDDLSTSTITLVNSSFSSSSSSSTGTLTDDDDESTARESRQQRDDDHFDTSKHAPAASSFNRDRHKTRTKPPICRHAPSKLQSPSSTENSPRPAEKRSSNGIQRIGNYGVTAPVTLSKLAVVPPPTQSSANQPGNRQTPASASSKYKTPSSLRWLTSQSTSTVAENGVERVVRLLPVATAVSRCREPVFVGDSGQHTNTTIAKTPTSPHSRGLQTQHSAAVKKAASAAIGGFSSPKSCVSCLPVGTSSKVVDVKRVTFQSPAQRASGTANKCAVSKIPSASRDYVRRTGSGAYFHNENANITSDRRAVDKSVSNVALASRPAAVKQITSPVNESENETVRNTNISRSAQTVRDTATPSTRGARTQTPVKVAAHSADSRVSSAVIKRPPSTPPKPKRPGSMPGTTAAAERGRAGATEQRRPASADCSAVIPVFRQPVDVVCRKNSDSCTDLCVTNCSASVQQQAMSKLVRNVLNKNSHLTRSHDCITTLSSISSKNEMQHGSSTSLHADMPPPRRLVKPYSVINRCSAFAQRISAAPKEDRSTFANSEAVLETERASAVSASRSQTSRVTELFDLSEVDECECDRSVQSDYRLSADERNRRSDNEHQLPTAVERTETVISRLVCPSIPQKPAERYRAEYSTFLTAVLPLNDEDVGNNVSAHQDCVYSAIKHDEHVTENSRSSKTEKTEDFQLAAYDEQVINAVRPATLSAENAQLAPPADSYIVTYESDNIIVLDREPVIDCLTPDVDVVSTEIVCQLLKTAPTNTAPGESNLPRLLPLSESGYDTWKSSQGSVAVMSATCTAAGSVCVAALDYNAYQQQRQEEDETSRRECASLKTVDSQSAPEQNGYTGICGICRTGDDNLSPLFGDESMYTESGAATAAESKDADNAGAESPANSDDDDNGRDAATSAHVDSAQMCLSICSDAAVKQHVSFPGRPCVSMIGQASLQAPPANTPASGLADPAASGGICFSSRTIPSNDDDTDVSSAFRGSSDNTVHLERFDEEAHNVSSLLPAMDHFRSNHVTMEISESSEPAVVRDDTCLNSVDISTKKTADLDGFDVGGDIWQSDQRPEEFSEVCLQLKSPWQNNKPSSSSTAFARKFSDSCALVDPYETICDSLLESTEDDVSDEETSHASFSTSQTAVVVCSTDGSDRRTSAERSEKLRPENDHSTTLTRAVALGPSDVDRQPTRGRVNSSGPATPSTRRLPVTSTMRRVRTNFSVVYRQTAASQSTVSHGDHIEASTRETLSHRRVDREPGTAVGCRRALALLASRLDDDNRRRRLASETDVDNERAAAMSSTQSVSVNHDPVFTDAVSTAVSLSSSVRLTAGHNEAPVSQSLDKSGLQNSPPQSPWTVQPEVKSPSAESKLSTSSKSTHGSSSQSKKPPSTFHKLLSSKLTNAVRRTQPNKTTKAN